MKVIIDRFEENFAVVELENCSTVNLPKELVPDGATEGSVLNIEVDNDATESRREHIQNLIDKLSKNG